MSREVHPDTYAVRGGLTRSAFDETSEALYLSSGFVYGTAQEAEAAFNEEVDRFVYSRYGNPTVAMFEERMRLLEGAEAAFATSTGVSAVFIALAALCGKGDRIVASRALFGSCMVIIDEILPRWGVERVLVDGADLDQWREALSEPTTAVFFETPSNPMLELVDIAAVCDLAHAAGAKVVVDNVFGTPVFSRPLDLGADIVIYSATKHIDGQGRALGGVILGPADYIRGPVRNLMRHTGPAMSPFNAWVMLKGLETMRLRVERQHESAVAIADFLAAHPKVALVRHAWREDHPQIELARRQMTGGG
ncbi:MAG TPA: aminotransferase class I/II-fold pyridoxal phosphate-dependent enzyme, partial [Dermatophilaceae bacterium]|nr:aminotransferase class I/II-fold pyridoxal phosphate-dependent enzyme [Dermatophilaceae bacterium]